MSYDKAVQIGKRLGKQEQSVAWDWGDACIMAMHDRQTDMSIEFTIRTFCVDCEYDGSWKTLLLRYYVAVAWPLERRVEGASFTAHQVLYSHPDRFNLLTPGMSTGKAKDLAGLPPNLSKITSEDPVFKMLHAQKSAGSFAKTSETLLNAIGVNNLNHKDVARLRNLLETNMLRMGGMLEQIERRIVSNKSVKTHSKRRRTRTTV